MYFLANTPLGLEFDPMAFLENLQYMGVGMVVIFAIISVIIGATLLINFCSPSNKTNNKTAPINGFFVGTVICFPGKIYLLSQNLMLLFSLAKFGDFPGNSVENAKTATVSDKSSNFPPIVFSPMVFLFPCCWSKISGRPELLPPKAGDGCARTVSQNLSYGGYIPNGKKSSVCRDCSA